MKVFLQKMSLLSLSLMLVSTFSTSTALPQMLATFHRQGYTTSQVDILFSIPSLMIMITLILTPWLHRILPERLTIIVGLLLIAFGGSLPAIVPHYNMIVVSRLLLGIGIGLINTYAISIISENFKGKERSQMLGFRGSFEVLGNAFLTILVGFLVPISWSLAFIVYLLALPILLFYILFSPRQSKNNIMEQTPKSPEKLPKDTIFDIVRLSLLAGFVILVNSTNSLRIPIIIEQLHLGNSQQTSFILSGMMLMGIFSGMCFERLLSSLQRYLVSFSLLFFAIGELLIALSQHSVIILIGAMLSGFWYSIVVTSVFNTISEKVTPRLIGRSTTLILLFCNLGGASAATVLGVFSQFNPHPTLAFIIYAVISFLISFVLMFQTVFLD